MGHYLVSFVTEDGGHFLQEMFFSITENDFQKYLVGKKLEACDGIPARTVTSFLEIKDS